MSTDDTAAYPMIFRVTFRDFEIMTMDEWEAEQQFRAWMALPRTENEDVIIYRADYENGRWIQDSIG